MSMYKGAMRSVKNITKGYSDIQIKVREATSNDPWGPQGSLMAEIAQATFSPRDFLEIMELIDKRLNDKGRNWRHVLKSLTLLDYCLHCGSENVAKYSKERSYIIRTLKEFQYIDDEGRDQGANIRHKAKEISALLEDDERLRQQRSQRQQMRGRLNSQSGQDSYNMRGYESTQAEDAELQRAIEESKRTAAEEEARRTGWNADARGTPSSSFPKVEEEPKQPAPMIDFFDSVDQQQTNIMGNYDPYSTANANVFGMNTGGGMAYTETQQQSFYQAQQSNPFFSGNAGTAMTHSLLEQQSFATQQTTIGSSNTDPFNSTAQYHMGSTSNTQPFQSSAMPSNAGFVSSDPFSVQSQANPFGGTSSQVDPQLQQALVTRTGTSVDPFSTSSTQHPFTSSSGGFSQNVSQPVATGNPFDASNSMSMVPFQKNAATASQVNPSFENTVLINLDNLVAEKQNNPALYPSSNKNPFASGANQPFSSNNMTPSSSFNASQTGKQFQWNTPAQGQQRPGGGRTLNELMTQSTLPGVGAYTTSGNPTTYGTPVGGVGASSSNPFVGSGSGSGFNNAPSGVAPNFGMPQQHFGSNPSMTGFSQDKNNYPQPQNSFF